MNKTVVSALVVSTGAALGGTAVVAQAGSGDIHASAAGTKVVGVKDDFYSPKVVAINRGSTIKWVWSGKRFHNVKGPGVSSSLKKTGTFTKKFTTSGTKTIVCTIHTNMVMKVIVRK